MSLHNTAWVHMAKNNIMKIIHTYDTCMYNGKLVSNKVAIAILYIYIYLLQL